MNGCDHRSRAGRSQRAAQRSELSSLSAGAKVFEKRGNLFFKSSRDAALANLKASDDKAAAAAVPQQPTCSTSSKPTRRSSPGAC